jgi:hypothetical protein
MNNWFICWFFTHILLGILIFKGLTARRLYKSFGVKELMQFFRSPLGDTWQFYENKSSLCVISGFHCVVNEILILLGCYAAPIGSKSPTFRDNLLVTSSRIRQSKKTASQLDI